MLATVFAVLAIVFLPSTPPQHCPRHDWNGIVVLGVAMFGLIGLLIAVGEPSDVTRFGLLILVTLLGGYLAIRRQRTGSFPIPEQACRSPRFRAAMYVAVSNYFCVGGAIFLLASVFFQARQHLSVTAAGVSLVPLAFGYAIGARISSVIIGRSGVFRAVVMAGLLMLASSSSIAVLIAMSAGVTTVSVVAMVLGPEWVWPTPRPMSWPCPSFPSTMPAPAEPLPRWRVSWAKRWALPSAGGVFAVGCRARAGEFAVDRDRRRRRDHHVDWSAIPDSAFQQHCLRRSTSPGHFRLDRPGTRRQRWRSMTR
ncbi:putative membrane protein [Mycobacterium kansasii]|uniref:Putative membrane protein n=1 Tax=Mycobacterium kansasii TaxID=1768 RepID=A0A1V3WN52_MYCKA|nr:putative membrane protein [Mycobacterium kansasii]